MALTPKEYDLLAFLTEEPGALMSREQIMEAVWDTNWFGPTETLDVHVAALRRKLASAITIEAVRGGRLPPGGREDRRRRPGPRSD